MNKEIKFLMKFDTSEFDRAIEKMQRQLREVYRPQANVGAQYQTNQRMDAAGIPGAPKVSMEQYYKSIQSGRAALDQQIAKGNRDQQSLLNNIAKNEEHRTKLMNEQKRLGVDEVRNKTKLLELSKEIANVELQQYRNQERYAQQNQVLNQALDARQKLSPKDKAERLAVAFGGGGVKAGVKEAAGMAGEGWAGLGMTGQIGAVLAGLALAAKTIEAGAQAYIQYSRIPMEVRQAQGGVAAATVGREYNAAAAGQGGIEMAYSAEKQKAMQDSKNVANKKLQADKQMTDGLGRALLFGITSWGEGGAGDLARAKLAGIFSKEAGQNLADKYVSNLTKQIADDYTKNVEANKQLSPRATQAKESFYSNMQDYLQFQRQTGMNYQTFHGPGGFREQMLGAGFTDQMGMGMSRGILAGGGSTRMAGAEGAQLGLEAERGYGLTNAGGILGQLSGRMGDTASTREAFIKMLAEGNKLGLDSSQFREENRKFQETTAELITRSGTTSQSDIDAIVQRFGAFVGGGSPTIKGMEAAKSAYDTYVSGTSQTGGAQGAMRAGGFLRDEVIGNLPGDDIAALAGIDAEHLTTDNPVIQSIVKNAKSRGQNISAEDLVRRARKAGNASFFRRAKGDQAVSRAKGIRANMGKAGGNTQDNADALQSSEEDVAKEISLQYGIQDKTTLMSLARGLTSTDEQTQAQSQKDLQEAAEKLGKRDTGVVEDKAVQNTAIQMRDAVKAFQEFHDTIVPTIEQARKYTATIVEQGLALEKATSNAERTKALLQGPPSTSTQPKNQTQGGRGAKGATPGG